MMGAHEMTPYEVGYKCGKDIARSRTGSVEDPSAAGGALHGRVHGHCRQMSEEEHESTWGIIDALADAQRLMNGIRNV